MAINTEAPYQKFAARPQLLERGKTVERLVRNDTVGLTVQVVASGGETNLHAHAGQDAIWFVLSGEATFYGDGDRVIATLARNEGLLIPHGEPYWFESSKPENLVILRFSARVAGVTDGRVDVTERKFAFSETEAGKPRRDVKALEGRFFGD